MSAITARAPAMAPTVIARSPANPRRLSATPPMLPDNRTTNATPRLAPEQIPSTDGPARGLRKTVCICRPLMARPAPATIATRVCGTLDLRMILVQMGSWSDAPQSMFHAARVGMLTEPRATLSRNSTRISAVMISILGMTERFIEPLRY